MRVSFIVFSVFFLLSISLLNAQIPQVISYQGVLSDTSGTPKPDGDYTFTFSLYDTANGGLAQWSEVKTLPVKRGMFFTQLGDQSPLGALKSFDRSYWLGIKVGNDPEMMPRIRLTSVPTSFHALYADTAQISLSTAGDTTWMISDSDLYYTQGNVGIGTSSPQAALHVSPGAAIGSVDATALITRQSHGSGSGISSVTGLYTKAETNSWTGNNKLYGLFAEGVSNPSGGSPIDTVYGIYSQATANTIGQQTAIGGYFSAFGADQNYAAIFDQGNVGIGTQTPTSELDVSGTIKTSGFQLTTGAVAGHILTSDAGGTATWQIPSAVSNISLDDAYDAGGSGAGRTITADAGAVNINGSGGIKIEGNSTIGSMSTPATDKMLTLYKQLNSSAFQNGMYVDLLNNGTGTTSALYGSVTNSNQQGNMTNNSYGVLGMAINDDALRMGIHGAAGQYSEADADGISMGVSGRAIDGKTAFGATGYAMNAITGYGVYGAATNNTNNYAGYFMGDVTVSGTLSKGSGGFIIDHPSDPANKYLYHSYVESSDMKNLYDGVAVLDINGEAVIQLPSWFEDLNSDFRYQLTCIGAWSPVYVADELTEGSFRIAGGVEGLKVSWQITGIRRDNYADQNRIPVEVNKSGEEIGKYLHPEAFGYGDEENVHYQILQLLAQDPTAQN